MLDITDIKKIYTMGDSEVQALRGISLHIDDGDFVAIMGPSGSGKSTLAHILGLLDVPTSGSYRLNGREVSQLSEDELAVLRRDEVGFIFQQFNLLPRMDALANVSLPLLYSGKSTDGERRSRELLSMVGLGERTGHRPNELSGGQQQRVAIARALVNRPKIILADEPTGNLDSKSEVEILTALKDLNAQGITVIMVTHEDEVAAQASRLIRVRDGVIQSDERLRPIASTTTPATSTPPANPSSIWKEWPEHLWQGFNTLGANKVRTALSMLGILIGVAAVVAMLALGRGAQNAIEQQLSSLGSNLLVLRQGSFRVGGVTQEVGTTTRLTLEDSQAIKEHIVAVKAVSANVSGRAQAAFQNKNWNTQVEGAEPSYEEIHSDRPTLGRFFTQDENRRRVRVAVIGKTVAQELFGGKDPIGESIKINRVYFQVIGLLPEKGSTGFRDRDDVIIVPVLTAMHRLMGKEYVDSMDIQIKDNESTDIAEDDVRELMYSRKRVPLSQREDAFQIHNMADIQDALSSSSRTMSALLASIAAISLLVGGIGIMNIMLVSVTERTKEIGLRKAVGARRSDILFQFLIEALVVSLVGGIAGILLGWGITLSLSLITGWATSVSAFSVILAFFFSALIGVVFGIYPARKASLLAPIDALRYE